jgi:cell cycle checkpoint protein
MILERLPYMAHISRRRRIPSFTARLNEIERVVSFSGIGAAADEDAADVEDTSGVRTGEAWATDKPTEESSPRKKSLVIRQSSHRGVPVASLHVQKLVLSDDDIEDE